MTSKTGKYFELSLGKTNIIDNMAFHHILICLEKARQVQNSRLVTQLHTAEGLMCFICFLLGDQELSFGSTCPRAGLTEVLWFLSRGWFCRTLTMLQMIRNNSLYL